MLANALPLAPPTENETEREEWVASLNRCRNWKQTFANDYAKKRDALEQAGPGAVTAVVELDPMEAGIDELLGVRGVHLVLPRRVVRVGKLCQSAASRTTKGAAAGGAGHNSVGPV